MDPKSSYPPGSGPPPVPNAWGQMPGASPPGWQAYPQQQHPPAWGSTPFMPSAPPSYEEACKVQAPNYGAHPGLPPMGGYAPNMPQTMGYAQMGPPQYPQIPPQQTVGAVGQYDAGARFTAYAPPTVPPPPPGCIPNAAQVAASSGQPVAMSKKKEGFLNGSGSGGYTFW